MASMDADEAVAEIERVIAMTDEEREVYFSELPPDGTSTKLVMDLMAKPVTAERDALIERAKAYYYDDFRSTADVFCPKIQLVKDLGLLGYDDLVRKTMGGEYD